MTALARELRYPDVSALYAAIGEGQVSGRHVVQRLVALLGGVEHAEDELAERVHAVHDHPAARLRRRGRRRQGRERRVGQAGRCCTPVPGDEILGFVTVAAASACTGRTAPTPVTWYGSPERLVEVAWAPSASSVFLVAIQVEALDRHRLLSDVTKVLADEKVNILSASVTTSR